MFHTELAQAVLALGQTARGLADADLEREYAWRYHDEGLRFALIGAYHELRDLAVATAAARATSGPPRTLAQRALAQYHAGYRDLQAVLLAADEASATQMPAPGEWPLWVTLMHILGAEQSFYTRCRYAADQAAAGAPPQVLSAGELWAILAEEPATDALRLMRLVFGNAIRSPAEADALPLPDAPAGSFADMLAYFEALHERVVRDLAALPDADTLAPSLWWEGEQIPVRFRLHRFDAHLRQHTIQIEKSLVQLGRGPSEAQRLLRLIYAALAEAEAAQLGAPALLLPAEWQALAAALAERTGELS